MDMDLTSNAIGMGRRLRQRSKSFSSQDMLFDANNKDDEENVHLLENSSSIFASRRSIAIDPDDDEVPVHITNPRTAGNLRYEQSYCQWHCYILPPL